MAEVRDAFLGGVAGLPGECVHLLERLVVASMTGRFTPLAGIVSDGTVDVGDPVAFITNGPTRHTVATPFGGTLGGVLARAGELVREGQPLVWLRTAAAEDPHGC